MRKYSSNNSTSYVLLDSNLKTIQDGTHTICFSGLNNVYDEQKHLPITSKKRLKYIIIKEVKCEETELWQKAWLTYLGEMFDLKYVLTDDTFMFESLRDRSADLIVCTLVRLLWEGAPSILTATLKLFKSLVPNGKFKKGSVPKSTLLPEFCKAWKTLPNGYWNNHHIALKPSHVEERTLEEFKKYVKFNKCNQNIGVMHFFKCDSHELKKLKNKLN